MVLYYLAAGQTDYDDNHSVVANLFLGRNTHYWKIPAHGLHGRLRFDPARCQGDFVLHELEVVAVPP
jgi:hypothetical protein